MLEFIGAWVMATLAITSPIAQDAAPHRAPAAVVVQQASAPTPTPLEAWRWSCSLPMVITPSAGPGVKVNDVVRELQMPVSYLRSLGYDVTIGQPAKYVRNAPMAQTVGQVSIVATRHGKDQAELAGAAARTVPNTSGHDALAATIYVDTDPQIGDLSADVLLHELGHVLGLGHKDHTVMTAAWDVHPIAFDRGQLAAVDCR